MIASGVVCQTMSHAGYDWCVSLLTLVAMGVQGQDVKGPWAPYMVTPEAAVGVREGVNLEITGPPAQEPLQPKTEVTQAQTTTPADDSQCRNTGWNMKKVEQSLLFMERAERSLLFITAAGVVCQIGDYVINFL